ncbi:MAG: hypothetical protein LBL79_14280 [Prevotella sp.]|jgi:hypothetical protein|nr:hypothetical protein [Prevotella sp.]
MTDHSEARNEFAQYSSLEAWLFAQSDDQFPAYYTAQGEISYPKKYETLKAALVPLHNTVEKGAMVESFSKWKKELENRMTVLESTDTPPAEEIQEISRLLKIDSIIYLNQHGTGHVDKVADKAFELLKYFTVDPLSPTEVFLLLCAIQVHDTGNVFGRGGHEINIRQATLDILGPIIPDVPTQNLIYRIAQVHSGNINGDKDTIGNLLFDRALFNKRPIREPVLAAILRFADELADDSSRADKQAIKLDRIPDGSTLYHQYSNALHAVNINENAINQSLYLSLDYYIESKLIAKTFPKNGSEQLLIDEIFIRTIKIERERRYCMRYFNQYLPLVEIHVQIQIDFEFDLMEPEVIQYTLKENGYPAQEITIECEENTGEKVIALLRGKGWRL